MLSFADVRTGTVAASASNSPEAVPKSTKSSTNDAKIEKSAKDFESILLSNWLQQAEESFAKVPGGDDDENDGATAQFTQMAMQSLGASFAGAGGIGIAKMISAQLHRTEGTAGSATGTESHETTSLLPKTNVLPTALNNAGKWPIR